MTDYRDDISQSEDLIESLQALIEMNDTAYLRTILVDLHPADIAEAVGRIDREKRFEILSLLDVEKAGEVLIELDSPLHVEYLQQIPELLLVQIVETMDSDDAADIIGELDEDVAHRVLKTMSREELQEVRELLTHHEETAGGIMALEIVAVEESRTASEAMEVLRAKADEVEDVYYIYVVDNEQKLKGFVSLKHLVLADQKSKMADIMNQDVASIHPSMDQEEVANLFHKYDLVSAPVVDSAGRLVGRITVDDVLDVVEEEASEDISMMAGITDENIQAGSVFNQSRIRLPWLLVAFAGELISAMVMSTFQAEMKTIIAAAFFIPLIMAMGGNAGIQSATVVIRGLATGDINVRDTGRKLLKELSVALLNGVVIALLLFGVVALWLQDQRFGMILSLAMIVVLFNAAFMGTLVPFVLKRLGIDPAIATGPFITTSNDVLGLLVYFGLISLFSQWFTG